MPNALIVEDRKDWIDLFERILTRHSYTNIEHSKYLEDALARARRTEFGLYLCDGDFPLEQEHGEISYGAFFEFYKKLTQMVDNPTVILATVNEENLEKARTMGIECYDKSDPNMWDALDERLSSD